MSQESLFLKKRSQSFHNPPDEEKKHKPWHVGKVKKKIFQKNQVVSKAYKKFNPFKEKKENWVSRKLKRVLNRDRQPAAPHNTTQFIVDAVYYPTDPYLYEFESNNLEYNFQHHAMAGSMMDLMQQKFNNNKEEKAGSPMLEEKENQMFSYDIPRLRMVRSAEDGGEGCSDSDMSENKNYSQYLNGAKDGKNLGDVIKHLVHVIRRKDSEINSLLSDTNKIGSLQEN